MTLRALVLGSTNVDQVLSVPRLPSPGETVLSPEGRREPGGKGANQAVALARLGARVRLVSAVGDDEHGRFSLAALAAADVDVADVRVTPAPTGHALVLLDPYGENCIVVSPGANRYVTPPDTVEADVALLSLEVPVDVVAAAARTACVAGVPVVLNAAPAQPLPADLLAAVDVLVVNETEWAAVGGAGHDAVVVTLGGQGCRVREGGREVALPAVRVQAVDTTGAGDCFAAALAYGVGSGWALVDAATFAGRAAALAVQAPGARGGLPTLAEVVALGA